MVGGPFHESWRRNSRSMGAPKEVGKPRMTELGLPGGWSVKDVIAHITWYERKMVGMTSY